MPLSVVSCPLVLLLDLVGNGALVSIITMQPLNQDSRGEPADQTERNG